MKERIFKKATPENSCDNTDYGSMKDSCKQLSLVVVKHGKPFVLCSVEYGFPSAKSVRCTATVTVKNPRAGSWQYMTYTAKTKYSNDAVDCAFRHLFEYNVSYVASDYTLLGETARFFGFKNYVIC